MPMSFSLRHPHTVRTIQSVFCSVLLSLLLSGCGSRVALELLEAEAISLRERSTRKLQHKGYPANAVRWESSNPAVATVDNLGYVTARLLGKTTISVIHKTSSRLRDSVAVEVVPAVSIKLLPEVAPALKVGGSLQLEAIVEGSDNQAVSWSNSNPVVANIAEGGLVEALAPGTATIQATSQADPGAKAVLELTILENTAIEVSLNLPSPQSLSLGNTLQLIASVHNTSNLAVRWESSDPGVAVVSDGLVEAKSVGNTTIRAISLADESKFASLDLFVPEAVSVTLLPSAKQSLVVGQTLQLQSIVNGSENRAVTWSSSATEVASVDGSGLVSALGIGQAILTATAQADAQAKASLEIEVVNVSVPATIVRLQPSTPQKLRTGESLQVKAEVIGSENPAVSWSSSNPQVAEVQHSGLVSAKALGVATITATAQADPSRQASLEVSVTEGVVVYIEPNTRQTLVIKETRKFSARVSGSPDQSVIWSSDHAAVASIDSTGLVRANATGTTTIRATSQTDSSAQALVQVDVVDTIIEFGGP